MCCPSLNELPEVSGRAGWPWSVASKTLEQNGEDASSWPKICIVTATYNQGHLIEETIRSVLLQGYPNLEYIIIDGGSEDGTVEVIKKYEKYLAYWVSEPDNGQSDAINKGLKRITGDIWAYINSDDVYLPDVFARVAEAFKRNPGCLWVTGTGVYFEDSIENVVRQMIPVPVPSLVDAMLPWQGQRSMASAQVSNFMRSSVLADYGYFEESLHYVMDFEYNLRLMIDGHRPYIIPEVLGAARLHPTSKTVSEKLTSRFRDEQYQVIARRVARLRPSDRSAVLKAVRITRYRDDLGSLLQSDQRRLTKVRTIMGQITRHPSYLLDRMTLGALRRIIVQ